MRFGTSLAAISAVLFIAAGPVFAEVPVKPATTAPAPLDKPADARPATPPAPAAVINAPAPAAAATTLPATTGEVQPTAAPATTTPATSAAETTAGGDKLPPAATDTAPAVAAPPPPPPQPTLLVDIDLTRQRMTVTERGALKHTWPISSGRAGYETPTGRFRPAWMAKMWYSKQYDDAPMPHSIFFNGGIAVHATYATGMLGRPASHGCIRLSPANAETLYKMVSSHKLAMTRINVTGKAKVHEPPVASRRAPQRYRDGFAYAPVMPPRGYVYGGYAPSYGYAPGFVPRQAGRRFVYPGDRVVVQPPRPTFRRYPNYTGYGYGGGYSGYRPY